MTWNHSLVAALVAGLLPYAAAAQAPDVQVVEAPIIVIEECDVPAPTGSSPFESHIWNDICLWGESGGYLAMDEEGACNAVDLPETKLSQISLSATFLRTILTDPEYVAIRRRPKVVFECVHIPYLDLAEQTVSGSITIRDSVIGGANLDNTEVTGDMRLSNNRFERRVWGQGLRVAGNLNFYKSVFQDDVNLLDLNARGVVHFGSTEVKGRLNLERAEIGKSLFLRDTGKFSTVSLLSAQIAGQLETTDSTFSGDLDARNLTVNHDLYLSDTKFMGDVTFRDLATGGSVVMNGTVVQEKLDLDRAKISKSLLVRGDANLNSVKISYIEIGSTFEIIRSKINGDIFANGISVDGNVYLRDGSSFQDIQLANARIRGHLQLQNSDFHGKLDLTETQLGSLLLWRSGSRDGTVLSGDSRWADAASLILRNTKVGSLQARMPQSWVLQNGAPLRVDLNGFQYEQLGGFSSGIENDLAQIRVEPLINWITQARPENGGYSPQPYRALQHALEGMGADGAARQVAYARLEHRAQTRITQAPFPNFRQWFIEATGMLWDRFLQITVGFGVYPQLAAIWFAVLVGAGTFLARRSSKLCDAGKMDCFWYSLENALPLIEPSEDHKVQHTEKRIRSFFHFQKVAGFVLASVLIGALTLGG